MTQSLDDITSSGSSAAAASFTAISSAGSTSLAAQITNGGSAATTIIASPATVTEIATPLASLTQDSSLVLSGLATSNNGSLEPTSLSKTAVAYSSQPSDSSTDIALSAAPTNSGTSTNISPETPAALDVKINFIVQPTVDDSQQQQRLRRRQDTSDTDDSETGFLTAGGNIVNSTSCNEGTTYTLNSEGMLGTNDNQSFYSTDPGVASAPFVTMTQLGSISTNWTIEDNDLVWKNAAFYGGVATICKDDDDDSLTVYYTELPSDGCTPIELSLLAGMFAVIILCTKIRTNTLQPGDVSPMVLSCLQRQQPYLLKGQLQLVQQAPRVRAMLVVGLSSLQ